ncbi:biotin/lipoyl-binding protein [Massilia brevitalea]|uniref:biotin/lipoyl-binding protein n=1 Tax=Massilia brevitalea TaxID=442526 RepID=UPI002738F4F5|nr:biotin/lipoyl-binding protein [Massilia brevitalea]
MKPQLKNAQPETAQLKNDLVQPGLPQAGADLWPGSGPAANDEPPAGDAPAAAGHARRSLRLGKLALALGLAGLLAWVAFAPLDEGVPAPGTVMVDTKRQPVQHLTGGLIKQVLVREGDLVKQGQPLVELDSAVARANFTAVRLRYLNERAAESRLLAEQNGAAAIALHPDVEAARQDPGVSLQIEAQQQLFMSRKAALAADLQAIADGSRGQQSAQVTIAGSATQHQTLTASNTLGDTDGMGNVSYRWLADGALVAVGSSYVLTQAQVGKAITVVASYLDAEGTVESVTSSATDRVANVNDAPTGAVLIAGNTTLGQTLTASNTLADQDGMGTVSYQWQANGADISGATGASLTLNSALIGKTIDVVARYTDGFGAAESVGSAASDVVRDGNGVAPSVEALAPALGNGGLLGDGNGDGILDALQPAVVSMGVPSASNGSSYVTLVAGAVNGKPVADANPLTDVHSVHNAIDLPSWAQAPMDGISFTAKVNAPGATENFSLYVDASTGVNGYWAKDASGVLVNLASAAYGGQMVAEGDKIRLDFHITEGSQFDVGVAGDSNIVSNGVAAHASLSLIGYVIDTPDEQGPGNAFD